MAPRKPMALRGWIGSSSGSPSTRVPVFSRAMKRLPSLSPPPKTISASACVILICRFRRSAHSSSRASRNWSRCAYRDIPVYRAKYQAAGFKPSHLRDWDDIQKIPVITKPELVAAFPDQCVNRKFKSDDLFPTRSSGSSGQTLLIRVDYDAILTDTIQGVRQFAMQSGGKYHEEDLLAHVYTVPWWFDSIGGKYPTAFISNLIPPARVAQHLRYLGPKMLSLYPSSLEALMPHVDEFRSSPERGGDAFGIFLARRPSGMVASARRARARRILFRGGDPHRARNAQRQLSRLRRHRASRRARSRHDGSRRHRASPASPSSPICSTRPCRSSGTSRATTSPSR